MDDLRSGATRVVGIIGWPVDHSLSPAIHNAAFRALGLDWVYVPLPVRPGGLPQALTGLLALGLVGANVTMPHKENALRACAALSEDAAVTRAVNTLIVSPHGLHGHNTDVPGFAGFLEEDAGFDPKDREALVYGAGGAARACVLALVRAGAASISVVARDPARAEAVRSLGEGTDRPVRVVAWADGPSAPADLIVNATPLDGAGGELPLPALRPGQLVVDLLYRPAVTPLVARARGAGADAFSGLGMLVRQAGMSFELWTGQVPPIEVMSAAALAELGTTPR